MHDLSRACISQSVFTNIYEPARDKTYKMACVPREDSGQPRHSPYQSHYEDTPIQIHWKFYYQKKKKNENFEINILIFFKFLLKT